MALFLALALTGSMQFFLRRPFAAFNGLFLALQTMIRNSEQGLASCTVLRSTCSVVLTVCVCGGGGGVEAAADERRLSTSADIRGHFQCLGH